MVKDSCVERLFVCTRASSLIMMSSHWCVPPSRSRKMSAFAWNIVRTYTLTPGRRYSFGCR